MPGWLLLVSVMSVVGPITIDMYLPAFNLIEAEFGEQGIERTMASYLIGIAVGQLIYGPLSDRFGRKPPLYFGFAVYSIGALGCALANSMTMLMIMRVVQSIGGCAPIVIGRAIVRDRCQPEEAARAFALLMLIFSLGPIVAPTLGGGFITLFGWRSVFVFQCVMGVALLLGIHYLLTESRDPAHVVPLSVRQVARSYAGLLRDRTFMGYSLIGAFAVGGLFSFVVGAPTVMMQLYQLSPQELGWMIGMNGVAFMTASRVNIVALRTQGPEQLLARAAWRPFAVGLVMCALGWVMHVPLWLSMLLQISFFVATALVTPHVTALGLAPYGKEAGSASALMGTTQSLACTLAGLLVGCMGDGTFLMLMLIMTTCAALVWVLYLWIKK